MQGAENLLMPLIRNDYPIWPYPQLQVGLRPESPIFCGLASGTKTHDVCLEPGKIDALKMLDLQTKSAMKLV